MNKKIVGVFIVCLFIASSFIPVFGKEIRENLNDVTTFSLTVYDSNINVEIFGLNQEPWMISYCDGYTEYSLGVVGFITEAIELTDIELSEWRDKYICEIRASIGSDLLGADPGVIYEVWIQNTLPSNPGEANIVATGTSTFAVWHLIDFANYPIPDTGSVFIGINFYHGVTDKPCGIDRSTNSPVRGGLIWDFWDGWSNLSAWEHPGVWGIEVGICSTLNNRPNIPSKPSGPKSGLTGISYTFSTSTTDPDYDRVKYGWDWDGNLVVDEWSELIPSGSTDVREHSWNSAGTYVVRVKSEDEHGWQSGWSEAFGIVIENNPLVVDAEGPYEGNIMEDIEFDSTVTGGTPPYEYLWNYGDGNTSTGDPHPTHNYGKAGNYTITLTVTDSEDDTASDTTWAYINAPPNPPIIDGPNSGKPETLYTYTFTSTDLDGDDIAEYIINWGDGLNETITGPFIYGIPQTKNHTWDEEGTYTIKAKAIDTNGAESDWASLEVSMPKSKAMDINLFLQRFFLRFPFFEKILNQRL